MSSTELNRDELSSRFADRLRRLRRLRGVSQSDLGVQIGVSARCIENWEASSTEPRLRNLIALSLALRVSMAHLTMGIGAIRK